MNMPIETLSAFTTITKDCKVSTDWGGRVDANMSITARRVEAFATKEMKTCWDTFWDGIVGEVARVACGTRASLEEISAHRHFCRVVGVRAEWPFKTSTCQ